MCCSGGGGGGGCERVAKSGRCCFCYYYAKCFHLLLLLLLEGHSGKTFNTTERQLLVQKQQKWKPTCPKGRSTQPGTWHVGTCWWWWRRRRWWWPYEINNSSIWLFSSNQHHHFHFYCCPHSLELHLSVLHSRLTQSSREHSPRLDAGARAFWMSF